MHSHQVPELKPGTILQERYQVGARLSSGGQGSIFDVNDLVEPQSVSSYAKIIKVVSFNPEVAKKLKTEAEKLSQFDHPGLPKTDGPDSYFEASLDGNTFPFSFLVMEKIDGINLQTWLEERGNQPIDEKRAIVWLKQLADILHVIHKKNYLHRDIKPQNIMVRPSGQLVLIDFGIAREKTDSYYDKLKRESLTIAGTRSYQAPEQEKGGACEASDFYSVGRTFIHLLTGIHPNDLIDENPYQLNWKPHTSHLSSYFADLIDRLLDVDPAKRLCSHDKLLARLELIESFSPKAPLVWKELPWLLGTALLMAIAWVGIRSTGLLRTYEFFAYDTMLNLRPLEQPDPRLVIITIDEDDEAYQEKNGMKESGDIRSLSDQAFLAILRKLFANPNNRPSVVGLDIFHDFAFEPNYFEEIDRIGADDSILYLCSSDGPGHLPPPGVPTEQVAFADLVFDSDDDVTRRHLMDMIPPPKSPCPSHYALSTMMAIYHLQNIGYFDDKRGRDIENSNGVLTINDTNFTSLRFPSGGYQNINDQGSNTILTNYRRVQEISEVGEIYSLREFLKADDNLLEIKDKIILIGVTQKGNDEHRVPLSPGMTYGIFIHAHQLSQLVSAILEGRSLIYPWATWKDSILIILISLSHGCILWMTCSRDYLWQRVIIASFTLVIGFVIFCYSLFLQGIWVAVVPATLSIMSFSGLLMGKASVLRKVVSETSGVRKIRKRGHHES